MAKLLSLGATPLCSARSSPSVNSMVEPLSGKLSLKSVGIIGQFDFGCPSTGSGLNCPRSARIATRPLASYSFTNLGCRDARSYHTSRYARQRSASLVIQTHMYEYYSLLKRFVG